MNTKLIAQIRKNMESKETAELLQIWTANDRTQYSDETFEAVKSILLERNINIPSQDSHTITEEKSFRIKRRSFILFIIVPIIFNFVVFVAYSSYIASYIESSYEGIHPINNVIGAMQGIHPIIYVIQAIFLFLGIYMIIGRLHDINKSGWWTLSLLIPLLDLLILLFLCILPGTKGENNYGINPRKRKNAVAV